MSVNGQRFDGRLGQGNLAPHDIFDMVWRRKWWVLPPMVIGIIVSILYSYSLPPIYRSSTLILVEPQKVPLTYVKSPVTINVRERLGWIKQQIMSRTNLERIIREFNLYRNEDRGSTEEMGWVDRLQTRVKGWVDRLQTRVQGILITYGLYGSKASPTRTSGGLPAAHIERMQKNVEVEVVGRGLHNAFTIAYSGKEPYTVMRVTNKLASLFIEQNLQVRERMAEGASEFLENQLQEAKRDLGRQEGALRGFKEQHMGALPEQIETNLKKLDRLQAELQTVNEALKRAEEQKILYERQFESTRAMFVFEENVGVAPESSLESPGNRLERLREDLARLQAQFTDQYPDIVLLKRQIKELETQYPAQSPAPIEDSAPESVEQMQNVQEQILRAELEANAQKIDADIAILRGKQREINTLMDSYERRIEVAYANEQKLSGLSRDYNMSLRNYQELLRKRLGAKLSENLEKRQKGEHFRMLDPAPLPEGPVKPNRGIIVLLGSLVSTGCGVGLAFFLSYLTPIFRSPEDFRRLFELPVLATIPRSEISRKDDLLVAVEEPDSVATEQYRILYTQIRDAAKEKSQKIFAISSAIESEGKSLTSFNLAVVMARDFGMKTLLLEGDLKRPSFSRYLRTEFEAGLVDILLDQTDSRSPLGPFADTFIPFAAENLSVLPAAKTVKTSAVLLSSRRMRELLGQFREQYDYILIDAPPVLSLSDMKIFTESVDGVLMVVRAESTPQGAVIRAIEDLNTEKLTGFILNDVWRVMPSYYRYSYHYYNKKQ